MDLAGFDLQLAHSASSLSAAYLNSILPGLVQHYGLDQDALLRNSGISQHDLSDPEYMVPFTAVAALFLQILQQTGDTGLGLEVGRLVQPRSYQVLGYAIMSSANLGEAIDRLIRYEKLVGKLGHTELKISEDCCQLHWHCPFQGEWTRLLKEAALAGWVTYGRSLLPTAVMLRRVCFDHGGAGPHSLNPERYAAIFQCPVHVESDWCGIEFDAALLQQPLVHSDPGLKAMMDARAEELLREFEQKINLVNELRAVVSDLLPAGEPTLDMAAERLQLTPRALQNRLRQAEVSFKDVVDRVRQVLVLGYMQDTSLTLLDLAFLLGFAEQSSFSRAFKRWFGQPPQQYRKRQTG
ncbi:MAG: AraC family transcriptional regulator [Ketobacter sp.]|nr:AraC family transcriptional regulator [Ketobacter sp.]